jgi:iron complex outermembrane receptor protein
MTMKRLLPFAIGSLALPAAALAQAPNSTGARDTAVLEEIVVTAERREASLQTVPVPVTALSQEVIENRQVFEARDLARYAPSLKMFNNITSPTNLSPSLRGSLQQDASLVVAESPFGLYVDDVYIARLNGNNIALADIERVEVLRGPQGTLYGRNTLSGAIKFVSRTPGDDSWLDASLGAGNFDQVRATFSAGGPLGDNGWAGSLSGLYMNKDGQFFNRNPTVADDVGLERNYAARGKLRYTGIDNLDIVAGLSYSDAKNDSGQLIPASTPRVPSNRQFTSDDLVPQFGTYVLNTPNVARAPAPLKNYPEGSTKQTIASLSVSYDFGAVTLRSITGYVKTEDFFSNDFSGNGLVNGANTAEADQWSEEVQLLGKAFDDKLSYLVGLYVFNEKGDQAFSWSSYLPPILPAAVPVSSSVIKAETDSYSAFAQVDYNFTDALKATAGIRYTKDSKDFSLGFTGFLPPITPMTGSVVLANDYTETTPRFGLDYTVATDNGSIDSLLLYGSAARGFKSGGYNGIAIFGFTDALNPYFPESNWTYEAGVKTDLFGNTVRINANYYYAKIDDLALNATVTLPNGTTAFPVQNAGKATIQGLEYEVTVIPTDGLTLFLAGTALTDGKYDSLRAGSAPANALANFGVVATPPQLPDYSVTVGFDYGFDTSFGRVTVGADWFQTADYITAATNDFKVKSYGIGNAFVGVGFGDHWEVRAQVRNFTDDDTITTGSRGFLGGFIPVRPREYLFQVNYRLN